MMTTIGIAMLDFWSGFIKKANLKGVFRGLAKPTVGGATEKVIDYAAIRAGERAAAQAGAKTVDYAAMKASRDAAKKAVNPTVINYGKQGTMPSVAVGDKITHGVRPKWAPERLRQDSQAAARRKQIQLSSSPRTSYIKEQVGSHDPNAPKLLS